MVQLLSNAGHTIIPISYKLNDYFKHHDIMASRLTVFDVANSAWMYRSTGRTLLNCRKIHETRCSVLNDIHFSQSDFFIKNSSNGWARNVCVIKIGPATDGRFSWQLLYDARFLLVYNELALPHCPIS